MPGCKKFHRGKICEYQEFRNKNGDLKNTKFEARNTNDFNLAMVRFWDEMIHM